MANFFDKLKVFGQKAGKFVNRQVNSVQKRADLILPCLSSGAFNAVTGNPSAGALCLGDAFLTKRPSNPVSSGQGSNPEPDDTRELLRGLIGTVQAITTKNETYGDVPRGVNNGNVSPIREGEDRFGASLNIFADTLRSISASRTVPASSPATNGGSAFEAIAGSVRIPPTVIIPGLVIVAMAFVFRMKR